MIKFYKKFPWMVAIDLILFATVTFFIFKGTFLFFAFFGQGTALAFFPFVIAPLGGLGAILMANATVKLSLTKEEHLDLYNK